MTREKQIVAYRLAGWSFQKIADALKPLSRSRAQQVFKQALATDKTVQRKWQVLAKKAGTRYMTTGALKKQIKKQPVDKRVLHTCCGCRGRFGAREMRTHDCVLKSWPRRYGKRYYENWKKTLVRNQEKRKSNATVSIAGAGRFHGVVEQERIS